MIMITLGITQMRGNDRDGECAIDYAMRHDSPTESEVNLMRFFAALIHSGHNYLTKMAGSGQLLESEYPLSDKFVREVGEAYLANKYKDYSKRKK